jgi:hypothetical protein
MSDTPGNAGAYASFDRAMGDITEVYKVGWGDVHGPVAQRSDPETGDAADFPEGNGPQGDAIHLLNYVRPVRDTG